MKKIDAKKVLAVLFFTFMVNAAYLSVNGVSGEIAPSIMIAGGGTLHCPVNTTYTTNQLTLEMGFGYGMGIRCGLTYDIDGIYKGPIPVVAENPQEMHVVTPTTGTVDLPTLSEGSHCLTITVVASLNGYHGANPPGAPFKPTGTSGNYEARWVTSIYFTIDTKGETTDTTPPVITDLTVRNNTYFSKVPLRFHVNEDISQATYSLDGQENITLSENTTLTDLTPGLHNLTIYAVDKAGNVGVYQASFTTAEQPKQQEQSVTVKQQSKPFPAALAAALLLAVGVALAIAVYTIRYRKRSLGGFGEENKPV